MKTLEWTLKNLGKLDTFIDTRFERRMMSFMSKEDIINKYSQNVKPDQKDEWFKSLEGHKQIPWTEDNIIAQLKKDVEFGIEKAVDHRGISASLMWSVCLSWCVVLENGLDKEFEDDYGWYGDKLFKAINEKYNFNLISDTTFDDVFYHGEY